MLQVNDQTKLPDGWEMKFDFNTRRFYFIDHVHKITSWEDPRTKYYQQQQQKQHSPYQGRQGGSSNDPHQAARMLSGQSGTSSGGQAISMSLMKQPSPSTKTRSAKDVSASEESADDFDPLSHDMGNLHEYEFEFRVMRSRYPTVDKDRIMSLLKHNNGDIHKAEAVLMEEKEAQQRKAEFQSKLTALKKEFADMDENALLGMLNKESGNLARCRAKLRAQQSEKQRAEEANRMLEQKTQQLKADFPQADLALIRDVLVTCATGQGKVALSSSGVSSINMYEARQRLTEMGMAKPMKSSSRQGSTAKLATPNRERSLSRGDSGTGARSSSATPNLRESSSKQQEATSSSRRSRQPSTESRPSSSRRSSKEDPQSRSARPSELFSKNGSSSVPPTYGYSHGHQDQHRAATIIEVVTPAGDVASSTTYGTFPGASKKGSATGKRAHGSAKLSRGPNRELVHGPQASHRVERVKAKGADASLVQHKAVQKESSTCAHLARGADHTLYHGPQTSLVHGPKVG